MLWTAEWLIYYELWHLTGEWLAPGVGYESVARMTAAEAGVVQGGAGRCSLTAARARLANPP